MPCGLRIRNRNKFKMSILSSLVLAILLALPIDNSTNLLSLNLTNFNIILLLCLIIIMGSIKLLTYLLSLYIAKFNLFLTRTNQTSLCTYIECLLLFMAFRSSSLNELITKDDPSILTDLTLSVLMKLSASILLPFSGLSILIIIICAAINSYQDSKKTLIFKELNIVCSSLLLILGITLIIENLNL